RASSTTPPAAAKETDAAFGRIVLQVPVGAIRPNSRQPRKEFDPAAIGELANSIRSAGLLQPVVVRPVLGEKSAYELIAGERRLRACKQLGWSEIPAIVMNATDQNAGVWALIENVHRADLNPMDRALSLKELASEFKLTHEALAEQVGLDRSSVTNLLRLADVDETTAGLLRKGLLSQGHAKALLAVANLKTRATLAESTVRGEWSVRALEREVQRVATAPQTDVPRGTPATRRRANIDALERKLSQALGTDVTIQTGRKPNTGKLQIAFYSLEQFEGVVSSLGLKSNQLSLDE
ncbi:MAG: ParB/RepB/Spo0J family partition protein, partial [Planctomycetota bacterium]